jgi:hypothetical protein
VVADCRGRQGRSHEVGQRSFLNSMFHRKSLWVVRFFWNNHLLRVRHGLRLDPCGNSSHSLLLLQNLCFVHGKVSWFLVNAGFCLSRLGMRCFSTADSDSPSAFNSRFSQKGARGPKTTTPESILDSTWKVSEAIFNSRRHILKRRSGILFPILFNCGSEVENGVKSIAMRRSSRFIFKCCHTWPGCGGLNWLKGVEKA